MQKYFSIERYSHLDNLKNLLYARSINTIFSSQIRPSLELIFAPKDAGGLIFRECLIFFTYNNLYFIHIQNLYLFMYIFMHLFNYSHVIFSWDTVINFPNPEFWPQFLATPLPVKPLAPISHIQQKLSLNEYFLSCSLFILHWPHSCQ